MDIPKYLFVQHYPQNPKNLGEQIRKYRIDSGLSIKQLSQLINVAEDTIIDWEKRNINPGKKNRFAIGKLIPI